MTSDSDELDPARYERLQEEFLHCRGLNASARDARLAELREDDPELVAQVEKLLAASSQDVDALSDREIEARGAGVPAPILEELGLDAFPNSPRLPESIGAYRVLRQIGAGGMGVVYEAEQTKPTRRVAIKVILAGAAQGTRLKRFQQEAEILGRLQHPGIAQIFEAGRCELWGASQPFIVMELIQGVSLLKAADSARMEQRQRLELIASVCDAVQHAHERGVIHRDLKPDNILLDDSGQPKILDFGIARVERGDLDVTMTQTAEGEIIGSLSHMSPEQVRGSSEEIGPRSDVYALGVLLFQLLTGRLPFDLGGLSITEALRRLSENEVPRLSRVDSRLRGDLETIVGKAVANERLKRYDSVAALGADLRNFLAHRPISARPPSLLYRAQRFSQRHKGLVATFAVLVVGMIASTFFAWRAEVSGRKAEDSRVRMQSALYTSQMREASRIELSQTGSIRLRKLLRRWHPMSDEMQGEDIRGWEWFALNRSTAQYPSTRLPEMGSRLAFARNPFSDQFVVRGGKLLDLATGEVRSGPQGKLPSAAVWSPDGTRAFVASLDGEIATVFEIPGGEKLAGFPCGAGSRVEVSPTGEFLALESKDSSLSVWRVATGEEIWSVSGALGRSGDLCFSPDGRFLAAGTQAMPDNGSAHELIVFEVASGDVWYRVPLAGKVRDVARAIAWSPDGTRFAMARGTEEFWVHSNVERRMLLEEELERWIVGFSWDAKGERLLIGGGNGWSIWELGPGLESQFVNELLDYHAWSLDGSRVVGSRHGGAKTWDLSTFPSMRGWGPVAGSDDSRASYSVSADGRWNVMCHGNRMSVWRTGDELPRGRSRMNGFAATLSRTGKYIAYHTSGLVRIIERDTLAPVIEYPVNSSVSVQAHWSSSQESGLLINVHDGSLMLVDVESKDAPRYIVDPCRHTLALWDAARGHVLVEVDWDLVAFDEQGEIVARAPSRQKTSALALSKGGEWLASGTREGLVRIHAADTLEELGEFSAQGKEINALAWHPTESRLAVGTASGELLLLDTDRLETVATFDIGHELNDVAWVEEGRALHAMTRTGHLMRWSIGDFSSRSPHAESLESLTSFVVGWDAMFFAVVVSLDKGRWLGFDDGGAFELVELERSANSISLRGDDGVHWKLDLNEQGRVSFQLEGSKKPCPELLEISSRSFDARSDPRSKSWGTLEAVLYKGPAGEPNWGVLAQVQGSQWVAFDGEGQSDLFENGGSQGEPYFQDAGGAPIKLSLSELRLYWEPDKFSPVTQVYGDPRARSGAL